jgi:hypothetical protein
MTSISQTIQEIRSMRKDNRDSKIPPKILISIQSIHETIKNGVDNGWKKVDWRNGNSKSVYAIKPKGRSSTREFGPSHNAFENRSKQPSRSEPQSIPLTGNISAPDGFRSQKYVSKFKKTMDVDDTILNTILLGKLNKFSQQNYDEIKEFITHIIDNGETDMIKCFMKLVFEKAATEEIFCPLYAKLLSELSTKYPILLHEMDTLYSQYMEIFDDVSENTENYNEICKRNIEKKYRRGYSQFLAELIKYDVIEVDIFIKIINKIISQIEHNCKNKDAIKANEECADCLMKITKAIQNGKKNVNIEKIRAVLKTRTSLRIQPLSVRNSDNTGISAKARFTILDMYESI